jgi:hypothetical protein
MGDMFSISSFLSFLEFPGINQSRKRLLLNLPISFYCFLDTLLWEVTPSYWHSIFTKVSQILVSFSVSLYSEKVFLLIYLFIVSCDGDGTQGFVLARQTRYHWRTSPVQEKICLTVDIIMVQNRDNMNNQK